MVKIGDIKKYKDANGDYYNHKVVFVSDYNYVTVVDDIVPLIAFKADNLFDGDCLDFINFKDKEEKHYVIHNKLIKDVDKKYQKRYSDLLSKIKGLMIDDFDGFYDLFFLHELPICLNLNQINKYYKDPEFIEVYTKYHEANV